MDTSDVLDVRLAAQYLRITDRTLRRLARMQSVPCFKVGGQWRFKVSHLDRWAEEQQFKRGRGVIMVAHSEEGVRHHVRQTLERDGYLVVTAAGGQEVMEAMNRATPAMIFLDLNMPGQGGGNLLKDLRSQHAGVPVVVTVGPRDGDLLDSAMQYSPIMLMPKAASEAQIIETVKGFLGQGGRNGR
jgi:excisionase family DNA binding protein